MGTKMAVAFANIFMARIEKQILSQSCIKPLFWKRYIDDVFSLWKTSLDKIESFVEKANIFHSTIKFTAEMSKTEITFLDTKVYKGVRFDEESMLDVQTHYKHTNTNFTYNKYTNIYSCHPPGVKKGFIKGEALRLLRTNSSQITFERNIRNFHNRLLERGYPAAILRKYLSEVRFADRKTALQQRNKSARKRLLPFVTEYHPALPSLRRILMGKWHLNQQRLTEIFKEPPLISYLKGKSLKTY